MVACKGTRRLLSISSCIPTLDFHDRYLRRINDPTETISRFIRGAEGSRGTQRGNPTRRSKSPDETLTRIAFVFSAASQEMPRRLFANEPLQPLAHKRHSVAKGSKRTTGFCNLARIERGFPRVSLFSVTRGRIDDFTGLCARFRSRAEKK